MNVYTVGALAGLGTGAVLAAKGRVGLGLACMAAGGGVWILGRRMTATAPAAQPQPAAPASPFATVAVVPSAQMMIVAPPPPPPPGFNSAADVAAAAAGRAAIQALINRYQVTNRADLAAEVRSNVGAGHF